MKYSLLAILFLLLPSCVSYTYKAVDGRTITINKFLTDTTFGKLSAKSPDGTTLEIENYKTEDRLADTIKAMADKLPVPIP